MRVLASTLRRHRGLRPLEDLQQRLLHALPGDIPSDRGVLALPRDLVDLVDVDDPGLGLLHVEVRGLDELEQDVLHVLAHVARLSERSGVGDRERDVQHPGEGLRQVGLPATGRADQQDVRLRQLHIGVLARGGGCGRTCLDSLVVVVDGDCQRLLRRVLADDVLLEELEDLPRLGQVHQSELVRFGELLLDDLVTQVDALVADVHTGSCDELDDLLLALATERALEQIGAFTHSGHLVSPLCRHAGTTWPSGHSASSVRRRPLEYVRDHVPVRRTHRHQRYVAGEGDIDPRRACRTSTYRCTQGWPAAADHPWCGQAQEPFGSSAGVFRLSSTWSTRP